jgi:hypothetical protein
VILAWGVACEPAPLVAVPGARAVLSVARAEDLTALHARLGAAGLLGPEPRVDAMMAALAREAPADPLVVSLVDGAVVVALPARSLSRLAAVVGEGAVAGEVVLGGTRRARLGDTAVLVQKHRGRALVGVSLSSPVNVDGAADVRPADLGLATVLEGLRDLPADGAASPPREGVVALRVPPVGLEVESILDGDRLVLGGTMPAGDAVRTALASRAPPFSCALADGAALVLAVPPLGAAPAGIVPEGAAPDAERFTGRAVFALYPARAGPARVGPTHVDDPEATGDPLAGSALIVAGVPKDAAALDALRAEIEAGGARRSATSPGLYGTAAGARPLQAWVTPALFAVAVGHGTPIASLTSHPACMSESGARAGDLLLSVDADRLVTALVPALLALPLGESVEETAGESAGTWRALAFDALEAMAEGEMKGGVAPTPAALLEGVRRVEVHAADGPAGRVRFEVAALLRDRPR